MSNISAINVSRLENMLQGKVLEYFTKDNGTQTSVSYLNSEGVETTAVVEKMDINSSFTLVKPTVVIAKDATRSDVFKALSDQYNLGLIEGIDYAKDTTPVVLSMSSVARIDLTILPNSYLYKGAVTVVATSEAGKKILDSMDKLGRTFQMIFFQGILSVSKPFSCTGSVFNGNQLTPELVKVVRQRLANNSWATTENLDTLAAATIFNYQAYQKEGEAKTVRVFLRDANRNLLSLAVIPHDDNDRPFVK